MRECSFRMIRLDTDNPHHRIFLSRKRFGVDSGSELIIITFDVGDEVVEYPNQAHTCGVNETADIEEARAFAHQLATVEVAPWKKDRK